MWKTESTSRPIPNKWVGERSFNFGNFLLSFGSFFLVSLKPRFLKNAIYVIWTCHQNFSLNCMQALREFIHWSVTGIPYVQLNTRDNSNRQQRIIVYHCRLFLQPRHGLPDLYFKKKKKNNRWIFLWLISKETGLRLYIWSQNQN